MPLTEKDGERFVRGAVQAYGTIAALVFGCLFAFVICGGFLMLATGQQVGRGTPEQDAERDRKAREFDEKHPKDGKKLAPRRAGP